MARPALVIRPLAATPHGPVVAGWLHAAWWEADGWSLAEIESFLARATGPEPPVAFVAEAEGTPLGTVSLDTDDLAIRPDLMPWLASLYVAPAARGHGIGRALVRHAEAAAHALGHPRLWLFTPDRAAFYDRLGWRAAGAERWHDQRVLLMRRDLG
jgi:predicted N-acetyltransferase YhbS